MSVSAISKRYARALVEIGSEQKKVEQFADELDGFLAAFSEEKNLRLVLTSPAFSFEKRSAVLTEVAKKLKLAAPVKNFLGLLLEKGRLQLLPQITADYRRFADELSGTLRAQVAAASTLDEEQTKVIRAGLEKQTGKKVILDTKVSPELIGGLKAEIGGRVFDGSLSTQLKRIEDTLTKG